MLPIKYTIFHWCTCEFEFLSIFRPRKRLLILVEEQGGAAVAVTLWFIFPS